MKKVTILLLKKLKKDLILDSPKSESEFLSAFKKVVEKNKDNPVFYCQYAYARASSVINKSKTFK